MTNSGEATVINDRYEIHRRIGRGGMADVFSSRDLLLDRQVAIKVLFPEYASDDNFVERFRREAQSAANLSHPNIVAVYDWGRYEGTYFIAMEEVQGRTLAEVLDHHERLNPKQAAEIASEVALALGFAHQMGVAHRDIKPANILIGSNGQVKVADFGIARLMNSPTESNLTQVGSVMGTATYFSPEQAQGAQPDPRSDLYSLGVVMYEMVAGRPPFTGESAVAIAYRQVHDAPQPLVQLVPDIPRPFEAIIARLLAKDPQLRYPSAAALRDDLRRYRAGEPVEAMAAAATARARPAVSATHAAGAAAGAAGVAAAATAAQMASATSVAPVRPKASDVPSTGMYEAGYPPGASKEAMYYDAGGGRSGFYALGAFVALIALVVGGVLLFQALSRDDAADEPSQFTLDDFTGRLLSDVTAELEELGLEFTTIAEENSEVPVGFVHRTDPVAGTVMLEGQTVQVFFNPDPQLQPVPQVVGIALEEAISRLEGDGFEVGQILTEETDEVEENTVISSDPPAGTSVRQGSVVDLVVAGPPEGVPVPGFIVGQTEIEARAALGDPPFEFTVTTALRSSDTVAEGVVLGSNPAAGELVPRGGDITIFVSSGPEPVSVPAVIGVTEGSARNTLVAAGLSADAVYVEVPPGSSDDGRVLDQNPRSGAQLDPGSTVTLTVGRALEAVTTPPPTNPPPSPAPTTAAAAPQTTARQRPTTSAAAEPPGSVSS